MFSKKTLQSWPVFLCGLVVVGASLAFYSAPVSAQELQEDDIFSEVVCDPEDDRKCAQNVIEGQPAAFDGQLLTTQLAVDLGLKAERCEELVGIEARFARRELQVELDYEKTLHRIDVESRDRQITVLEGALEDVQAVPWHREPWFVASVASVVTVAVLVAAVKGAQALGELGQP